MQVTNEMAATDQGQARATGVSGDDPGPLPEGGPSRQGEDIEWVLRRLWLSPQVCDAPVVTEQTATNASACRPQPSPRVLMNPCAITRAIISALACKGNGARRPCQTTRAVLPKPEPPGFLACFGRQPDKHGIAGKPSNCCIKGLFLPV